LIIAIIEVRTLFPTGFCPDIGSHTVHPALAWCPEPCLFGGRDGGLWEFSDLSCHSFIGSSKLDFFFSDHCGVLCRYSVHYDDGERKQWYTSIHLYTPLTTLLTTYLQIDNSKSYLPTPRAFCTVQHNKNYSSAHHSKSHGI
jgi:hypothetical protein